ncbi:MAG: hypothetical protein LBS59_09410 [Puniceicoccales bacterium]|jgi:hypothetical protein|nr:hypothetical protein [Puniceicoccales bacterium]
MRAAVKWLPCAAAALLWVFLNGLIQPFLSRSGILLYTDAALLLAPARLFPRRPAVIIVLFAVLAADTFRASPFGLSASLLLPLLLLLLHFQEKINALVPVKWIALIACLNTFLYALCAVFWTIFPDRPRQSSAFALEWVPPRLDALFESFAIGATSSALLILLLGYWFLSLQRSLLAWSGAGEK